MDGPVPHFAHVQHRVVVPALQAGHDESRKRVLISGGGPVGLAAALALARHGVPCLIVEADTTVCIGSRAICLSRRTLEILDRLGVLEPFVAKGLPWTGGRSFYRRDPVLHFRMPHDDDQRLAPMTNIQQYHIEQFLLDEALKHPDLIEIRWGTRVNEVEPGESDVEVELEAEGVTYTTRADYVVGCDGARSRVRQALGLRMKGTAYEGRYVIVDIEIDAGLPTERFAWFDPPSHPGRTMLMHRQPDNLWRLDYQLLPGEDADEMIRPENVAPVVAAHLEMIGIDRPWRLVWTSTYQAAALSLDHYRHGRVLFAGDAAHLVPIFGVRGLNSGFDDAFNLGWKLASVLEGRASDTLLDSYSQERRRAWEVNVTSAMKSTEFMAPPSRGYEVMRDAVLSLAARHPALATLINPRQSRAIEYDTSALSTWSRDEGLFRAGPAPGAVLPECPLIAGGRERYLTELLAERFTLIVGLGGGPLPETLIEEYRCSAHAGPSVAMLIVGSDQVSLPTLPSDVAAVLSQDVQGRFRTLYDAEEPAIYLVRPDGHVCARWRNLQEGDLADAAGKALGGIQSVNGYRA